MTSTLRHYLLTEHAIGSAIFNILINALIAWLSFRHLTDVPMWGAQSIGGDLIGTTIVLPLLTCLVVSRIVGMHMRRGKIDPSELGTMPTDALDRLPDGLFARGLVLGAITMLVAAPILLALLYAAGVESLDLRSFVLFKAAYAGMLAALVQPVVALRAIRDGAVATEAVRASAPAWLLAPWSRELCVNSGCREGQAALYSPLLRCLALFALGAIWVRRGS